MLNLDTDTIVLILFMCACLTFLLFLIEIFIIFIFRIQKKHVPVKNRHSIILLLSNLSISCVFVLIVTLIVSRSIHKDITKIHQLLSNENQLFITINGIDDNSGIPYEKKYTIYDENAIREFSNNFLQLEYKVYLTLRPAFNVRTSYIIHFKDDAQNLHSIMVLSPNILVLNPDSKVLVMYYYDNCDLSEYIQTLITNGSNKENGDVED